MKLTGEDTLVCGFVVKKVIYKSAVFKAVTYIGNYYAFAHNNNNRYNKYGTKIAEEKYGWPQ